MSLEAVLEVVDRARADEDFRELLLQDPQAALKGAQLTHSERSMLKGLGDDPYASSPRGLADVRKMVLASLAYGDDSSNAAIRT